ncbi:MAG TPA: toxin-antitoxin system HicB family antitoxin [Longimicrobium sp.]|jgi:hypothetical protein
MSTIRLRFPDSLHERVRELAAQEGISVDRFIVTAVVEKIRRERARRESRARYDAALTQVPDVEPDEHDQL